MHVVGLFRLIIFSFHSVSFQFSWVSFCRFVRSRYGSCPSVDSGSL